MAIAISVYAIGAIANYSDLYAEVCDLIDQEGYDQRAFDRALRKAEAYFSRELRTPAMETRIPFEITGEYTRLPDDFLEMRWIYQDSNPDTPLRSYSPAALLEAFHGIDGDPQAYAIEGRELHIGPVGKTTLSMVYYQKIPPLTDGSVSNWLLRDHPDLYVAGVMYYLARRERDTNGAAEAFSEVRQILDSISLQAIKSRWGAGPLRPAGIRQVSSRVRA